MLEQIDYWLKGYVRIRIAGKSSERIINLLLKEKIELWDVIRIENELYTNIKLDEVEEIKEYLTKINCEFEVIDQNGLPIIIKKIMGRKFIAIGIITFIILIYTFSSFIFFIEIKGNEKVKSDQLIKQLRELKVRPGVLKSSIPLEELEEIIIQKNRKIAWANLYFRGTKLILRVVEKRIVDTEMEPSSLVAKKSGVISKLIVLRGTPVVEKGDTVNKGDILISKDVEVVESINKTEEDGEIKEETKTKIEEVKAAGIVKAKVWYEGYGESRLVETISQITAQKDKSISLRYKDKEIILTGPKKTPYDYFKVKESIKSLPQWRNINLPLEIITRQYIKVKKIRTKRSINQAKEIAKEKAVESILQQLAKEVIIMNSNLKLVETEKEKSLFRVKAILEVEEDIVTRRE